MKPAAGVGSASRIAGLMLVALVAVALVAPSRGAGLEAALSAVATQPVLGTADRDMTLMGAGKDGESWGFRRLPLEVGQTTLDGRPLEFGQPSNPSSPDPQLVFLRHRRGGEWQVAQTPIDEQGAPYRGLIPNEQTARITPGGGGLLLGRDHNRPADSQVTVLRRDPGGRFQVLPAPGPDILFPENEESPAEALATGFGSGDAAATAFDHDGKTAAFFAIKGPSVEGAVAYFDGETWSREPVVLPGVLGAGFKILAIAAGAADNAWLVARATAGANRGVVLFQRSEDPSPRWIERRLGAPLFESASDPGSGISALEVLPDRAQPLTVTDDGVWIDGRMQAEAGDGDSGKVGHFTLFFDRDQGQLRATWCDAAAHDGRPLCTYPLGVRLSPEIGYRSFAWAGEGFGTRVITNPLDPTGGVGTNRGSFLRLDGSSFVRMPGAGGNFRDSGAFVSADEGWLEGPVQVTREPQPRRLGQSWPLALRSPLTSVAHQPGMPRGSDRSGALAVGADGSIARYDPASSWTREFLLSGSGAVSKPTLRGVAWPETFRAHAVGDLGAIWLWRAETGLWEKDPATPIGLEANLMDVAFDPGNPERGYAVGRDGALLAYGKTWSQEPTPIGARDLTQVSFAGSQALVAAGQDLLVNDGGGWRVDASAAQLLRSTPGNPRLFAVAGLPDGGAVAAGEHFVIERDQPNGPWRFADQPLPGLTVIAAAALREGGLVRSVVSVVPERRYPPFDNIPPPDPNVPPPLLPAFPLPADGYVLRETGGGWRDEERSSFAGSGLDRPVKSDPILDFDLDASGNGWAVGGWSGEADSAGRGSSGRNETGRLDRQRVQTAAVIRYGSGADRSPATGASPLPMAAGRVRFTVASHGQCEEPCSLLASQGIGPDRGLQSVVSKSAGMAASPSGPRFLLYAGGRISPAASGAAGEAGRYAALLGSQPGHPVFGAVSAGDVGATSAYRSAFEGFPAPFGRASAPAGVDASGIPGGAPGPGARTHFAFDSSAPGGTLRVIVIDNSAGSLAASDPHQNPPEPQRPWLEAVLADARSKGIPAIVVGSRDLNTRFSPRVNVASDGDDVGRLLVEGGASAYFFERPEENRTYRIPSGGAATIPSFGTGTLAYRSATSNVAGFRSRAGDSTVTDQPDALFGDAGFLLAEVDLSRRDPHTNRAPVAVRLVPLVEDVSLLALDGTLLRRSRPALFQGIGRRPHAGDRWGRVSSADGNANPPGGDPYVSFPPQQCLIAGCSTRLTQEYEFTSSDPDIGDFVKQDPNSSNLRKPFIGADDKVVTDSSSGLFCAFNAGTTTATVRAGGIAYSQVVRILPGSVQRPCGTRPLRPDRFRRARAGAAPPAPPPPAPGGNQPATFSPPPPPPPPAAAPPGSAPPPAPTPSFLPPLDPLAFLPPVALATPPPGVRPSPPTGGLGRAYQVEEKREEEAAPEESSASFARYQPDGGSMPPAFVLGAILLAALAGSTIRGGPRARPRRIEAAVAANQAYERRRRIHDRRSG